jgi:hypothetical protein
MTFSINSFPEILFLIINFGLFIFGIIYTFRSQNLNIKIFRIFTFFSILIWFLLIILGSINLSPDRHSLILLPFFVIYIYFGARFVSSKYIFSNKTSFLYIVFVISFSYFFFKSHNIYFKDRIEPYSSNRFKQFIDKYNPGLIVARDQIIYLMPELYNEKMVYFLSNDKSRNAWVTPKVYCVEPNYIAFIGDSATEYLEKNIPKEVKCKLLLHNFQFEDKYRLVDSIQISSKTDEVNDKFTRWINLRALIFKKVL